MSIDHFIVIQAVSQACGGLHAIFAYVQQKITLQMKKPVTAAEPHSPQIKVVGRMGETEFATGCDASRTTMRAPQVQPETSCPKLVHLANCPYFKLVNVGQKISGTSFPGSSGRREEAKGGTGQQHLYKACRHSLCCLKSPGQPCIILGFSLD